MTFQKIQKNASGNAQTPQTTSQLTSRPFALPAKPTITKSTVQTEIAAPTVQQHQEQTQEIEIQRKTNLLEIPGLMAEKQTKLPKKRIQAKLTIGQPGDKYEQEADTVVHQVVQRLHAPIPSQRLDISQSPSEIVQGLKAKVVQRCLRRASLRDATRTPTRRHQQPEIQTQKTNLLKRPAVNIQRQMMSSEKLQPQPMLQRRQHKHSGNGMTVAPDLEASIQQARSGGHSLAKKIRQPMEQAFGADFSRVKLHTDATSDQLNQSIQAKAFTTGKQIQRASDTWKSTKRNVSLASSPTKWNKGQQREKTRGQIQELLTDEQISKMATDIETKMLKEGGEVSLMLEKEYIDAIQPYLLKDQGLKDTANTEADQLVQELKNEDTGQNSDLRKSQSPTVKQQEKVQEYYRDIEDEKLNKKNNKVVGLTRRARRKPNVNRDINKEIAKNLSKLASEEGIKKASAQSIKEKIEELRTKKLIYTAALERGRQKLASGIGVIKVADKIEFSEGFEDWKKNEARLEQAAKEKTLLSDELSIAHKKEKIIKDEESNEEEDIFSFFLDEETEKAAKDTEINNLIENKEQDLQNISHETEISKAKVDENIQGEKETIDKSMTKAALNVTRDQIKTIVKQLKNQLKNQEKNNKKDPLITASLMEAKNLIAEKNEEQDQIGLFYTFVFEEDKKEEDKEEEDKKDKEDKKEEDKKDKEDTEGRRIKKQAVQTTLTGNHIETAIAQLCTSIDVVVPDVGDKRTVEVLFRFPIDGTAERLGFRLRGEAERESESKLKIKIEYTFVFGYADFIHELLGEFGGYVEAQKGFLEFEAKNSQALGHLISYGLYRRFKESRSMPKQFRNFLWGRGHDKGGEAWAAAAEQQEFANKDTNVITGELIGVRDNANIPMVGSNSLVTKWIEGKKHSKSTIEKAKGELGAPDIKEGKTKTKTKTTGSSYRKIEARDRFDISSPLAHLGMTPFVDLKLTANWNPTEESGKFYKFDWVTQDFEKFEIEGSLEWRVGTLGSPDYIATIASAAVVAILNNFRPFAEKALDKEKNLKDAGAKKLGRLLNGLESVGHLSSGIVLSQPALAASYAGMAKDPTLTLNTPGFAPELFRTATFSNLGALSAVRLFVKAVRKNESPWEIAFSFGTLTNISFTVPTLLNITIENVKNPAYQFATLILDDASKQPIKAVKSADKSDKESIPDDNPYTSIPIKGDGNCFFRAVSRGLKLQYDIDMDDKNLRQTAVTHLRNNRANFEESFLSAGELTSLRKTFPQFKNVKTYDQYLAVMAKDKMWGGEVEALALMEELETNIIIHRAENPKPIFGSQINDQGIHLQFVSNNHFNLLLPVRI
ncbi:DUF4157 domain-containing protein [Nostoc sp. NMS4]|uniref:eCIS core domain-containing protein n=1 Tax=Nostoc sp. NMS4 TaxID=2815390 RepID=UPI0025DED710|nr:DUF4157 domain-containing protein [Nostoc sp. NMS4]MBN3925996.1 DUF4157 domain-containing protein [Nostoc sp. NMS4]